MHVHTQYLKLRSTDYAALLSNCQVALVKPLNFSKLHFPHLKKMNHTEVIITENYLILLCLSVISPAINQYENVLVQTKF